MNLFCYYEHKNEIELYCINKLKFQARTKDLELFCNKNCTVCNMKIGVVNYFKHGTVGQICYNRNRRKNNNNTSHQNQKSKVLITITIEPQSQN